MGSITAGVWKPLGSAAISGPTYSAGTGLTLSGTTFSHAAHTGDVMGNTALTIANNAVTSAKILDGTIANADIANNTITAGKITGGTAGQILTSNGTSAASWANARTGYITTSAITFSETGVYIITSQSSSVSISLTSNNSIAVHNKFIMSLDNAVPRSNIAPSANVTGSQVYLLMFMGGDMRVVPTGGQLAIYKLF